MSIVPISGLKMGGQPVVKASPVPMPRILPMLGTHFGVLGGGGPRGSVGSGNEPDGIGGNSAYWWPRKISRAETTPASMNARMVWSPARLFATRCW